MTIIGSVLASVLAVLAAFHVVWVVRGPIAESLVVPRINGRPAFTPTRATTAAVAFALTCAAIVALCAAGVLSAPLSLSAGSVRVVSAAAGVVFALRAIGELRLVGFFKRERNSRFARWDTWCFSPLCTLISAGFFTLASR